jgi:hypothetical protein
MNTTAARRLLTVVAAIAVAVPFTAAATRSRFRPVRSLKAQFLGARLLADEGVELQSGRSDCGPTALRAVLALRGIHVRETATVGRAGWSPAQIVAASIRAGVYASAVRMPRFRIASLELPAIALLGTHYVLIERRTAGGDFIVIDPDLGRLQAGIDYLHRDWTDHVVIFPVANHDNNLRPEVAAPERHSAAAGPRQQNKHI